MTGGFGAGSRPAVVAGSRPAVVAVGGGHGLAASLRAIRRYAGSITAIVSVADDGGSSGRLRAEMPELPAPGDVRRCLGALADPASPLGATLEHRFAADGPLDGHAYGNLLLAALAFGLGSFPAAVAEVGRMTGAAGMVVPATVQPVELVCTPVDGGERIVGQVAVANAAGRRRLSLTPEAPASPAEAAASILAADQVVIGPGSLYTSVLATAIVPAVRDALVATAAQRVYVANLCPQAPETAGFDLADHLGALRDHGVPVDVVLARPGLGPVDGPCEWGDVTVVTRAVADDRGRVHDPVRLADALADLAAHPPVRPRSGTAGPGFAAPDEVN